MQPPSFLEDVKRYVGFDAASSAALREAHPLVAPHVAAIADDFYAAVEAHPRARLAVAGGAARIRELKGALAAWVDELFRGPHDDAYFERHARVGPVRVQIDLPQPYLLAAMDRVRVQLLAALRRPSALPAARVEQATVALHQLLDLELAVMLEAAREDLLAKGRAAERLAAVGQLSASIGHELRNPLGVIESSAFLLARRLEQLAVSDAELTKHLERIAAEVRRSTGTIDDLLALARSRPLKRRAVRADAVLIQALAGARLPAAVVVESAGAEGVVVDADPDQLARVLANLLVNAGQAMEGAGRVWIDVRRDGARVVWRVRDEGPGVPAELRGRLFEALLTTKPNGTGLGLALCKRIVDAHGGTLALAASARGAVFEVAIPDAAACGAGASA